MPKGAEQPALQTHELTAEMRTKWTIIARAEERTLLAGKATKQHERMFVGVETEADSQDFRVMYGVHTCAQPKYRQALEAQLQTWAEKPRQQGLFFAAAGEDYPAEWQEADAIVATECRDGLSGNSCKEATLIAEAARRNVSWLVILGEDNYVDTKMMEHALRQVSIDEPVGLGCLGCGLHTGLFGKQVDETGGMCGGCGEAINRAALQRLAAKGKEELVREVGDESQCDMATSEAMLERSIPLKDFPARLSGNPRFSSAELYKLNDAATVHYLTPEVMRWLHGMRSGSSTEALARLNDAAFDDRGCVRYMPGPWWDSQMAECRQKGALAQK
eukprot:CAMPEP_0172687738 /NCGR_PEP_ID=MMETSP1074-20121228/21911_1 /TAXON_ID=2916 /ORGANISM="Ceratium fusus, Strain PA161109" /LENGTH=331 /DNA_ID=CAMNT_0013507253 /DNA_START=180 /DNA_END=1175 /DNA_ORIENTATION=-